MSIRQNALNGLVTTLQQVTVAGGYSYNLNAPNVVDQGIATRSMRLENPNEVQVQIQEGLERHQIQFASPMAPRLATLELVCDCMVRDAHDEGQRQRLGRLLADINKRLGLDPTLGGAVNHAWVAQVDEPIYDAQMRVAWVKIRLAVDYDYTAGTTI